MKLFFQIWATIILVIAGIIGVGFLASWACQQLPWLDDVLTGLLLLAMTGVIAIGLWGLIRTGEEGNDNGR